MGGSKARRQWREAACRAWVTPRASCARLEAATGAPAFQGRWRAHSTPPTATARAVGRSGREAIAHVPNAERAHTAHPHLSHRHLRGLPPLGRLLSSGAPGASGSFSSGKTTQLPRNQTSIGGELDLEPAAVRTHTRTHTSVDAHAFSSGKLRKAAPSRRSASFPGRAAAAPRLTANAPHSVLHAQRAWRMSLGDVSPFCSGGVF